MIASKDSDLLKSQREASWLDIVLSPTGKTFVNGQMILLPDLLSKLCHDSAESTIVRVFAGSMCRFDHLANVFRLCKQHGIHNVQLVA